MIVLLCGVKKCDRGLLTGETTGKRISTRSSRETCLGWSTLGLEPTMEHGAFDSETVEDAAERHCDDLSGVVGWLSRAKE